MELLILNQAAVLLKLLDAASKEWRQSDVAPSAIEHLNSLRQRIANGEISGVLDLLELTYRHALQSKAVDLAAPIHEGIYNVFVRSSVVYCFALLDNETVSMPQITALLRELVPDPVILDAMLTNQPITTSLVHTAKVQLGYLHRRTPALERLCELLDQNRARLPIARPKAFEEFLARLRRLVVLGNMLSE